MPGLDSDTQPEPRPPQTIQPESVPSPVRSLSAPTLLQPQGLESRWAYGPLAFHVAGPACPDGPSICLLTFAREGWRSQDQTLHRVLASTVKWAKDAGKPLPTLIHPPNRNRYRPAPAGTDTVQSFDDRGVWLLLQTVSTTWVVSIHEPGGTVELLPCPSISSHVPVGGMSAAETWLPPSWFNPHCCAVLKALQNHTRTGAQMKLDLE